MVVFKKILITGSDGFIAKNLITHLQDLDDDIELLLFNKNSDMKELESMIKRSDFIFHLAGENRPDNPIKFSKNNTQLTKDICKLASENNPVPICFTSSTQALLDNDYGSSKLAAENILIDYSKKTLKKSYIYRLPGVFGKWSRPNYNSVVSTFCYNIANNKKINIHDPSSIIDIVYIDDVIKSFKELLLGGVEKQFIDISNIYSISLGSLAKKIRNFHDNREKYFVDKVGEGLTRALYSTYLSYLPMDNFYYNNKVNKDERGVFAEIIKTENSGQISFFTAKPNVTRGIHYHHTKTEKFTVINGKARLRFKNIITGEKFSIDVSSENIQTIDTIPGWAHDITNIGSDELIVILWANEIFDSNNPDTYHKSTS